MLKTLPQPPIRSNVVPSPYLDFKYTSEPLFTCEPTTYSCSSPSLASSAAVALHRHAYAKYHSNHNKMCPSALYRLVYNEPGQKQCRVPHSMVILSDSISNTASTHRETMNEHINQVIINFLCQCKQFRVRWYTKHISICWGRRPNKTFKLRDERKKYWRPLPSVCSTSNSHFFLFTLPLSISAGWRATVY